MIYKVLVALILAQSVATGANGAAHDGRFEGVKGTELGYRIYENDQAKAAVVLVNGFTETYLMYDELAAELVQAGYRVYTYDHRGQGVSDRLLAAVDVGYVEAFHDYIDDLQIFLAQVVKPHETLPLNLIAHSTGGLISVHYAAEHPEAFRRMVLSAPFFELNMPWVPERLVEVIVTALCGLGHCSDFAPMQDAFEPASYKFQDNRLTHSEVRFEQMKARVWSNPALLIRGASNAFLRETIRAGREVPRLATAIKVPVLLFQAENDDYVRPGRQNVFCDRTSCQKVLVSGSYHELLFEAEPIRSLVVAKILHFLEPPR